MISFMIQKRHCSAFNLSTLTTLTTSRNQRFSSKRSHPPASKRRAHMSSEDVLKRVARLPASRAKADYSLRDHLQFLYTAKPTRIVIGNESADFDSIVSALVYSHLCGTSQPVLPVINAPRADIKLRRDVCTALSYVNITESLMYSIDDRKTTELLDRGDVSITLVDHNSLSPDQTHLSSKVDSVIDHHADEELFLNADPRQIEPVGSCSTLIAKCFDDMKDITPAAGFLLLSAILLDCQNMDKRAGKAKPLDEEVATELRQITGLSNSGDDTLFFDLLFEARKDLSGFSAIDLLRKDTKIVASGDVKVAICSVLISAESLLDRVDNGGLQSVVKKLYSVWDVQAVIVMAAFTRDESLRRELLIHRGGIGNTVASSLSSEAYNLELEVITTGVVSQLFYHFDQGNVKASRKVIVPIMKELMGQW